MDQPEVSYDSDEVRRGFLQERLWVILLPLLLLLSVAEATWLALHALHREEAQQTDAIKARLKKAVHGVASEIGHAVESNNQSRYAFLVSALGLATGTRVSLHHGKGGMLAQGGPDGAGDWSTNSQGTIHDEVAKEILVWGPVTGVGGRKVGEIRLHHPVPAEARFPWSYWSGLVAILSLVSGLILLLVTRVLSPLRRLGQVFRDLGDKGPHGVHVPKERFAEFGQLRLEIMECVDRLIERQLKAEESFVEVAFSLAREYEYHREGRIGHGQRTRRYAAWVAERLRLPPKERDALEVAALCHDIGKMPQDESNCWGAGDVERLHPALGAAFFEAMPGLEDVARIIHAHHERYDGSGFPLGLAGNDIPIGARILRIADGFERLYSDEGGTMSLPDVLDEMEDGKGSEFDPYLLDLFRDEVALHMLERRRLKVTLKAYQFGKASLEEAGIEE